MSLLNDPRNEFEKLYTVDRLGNVVGGIPIRYVNTDINTIKKLAINVLKSGNPVWFGCDVGRYNGCIFAYQITRMMLMTFIEIRTILEQSIGSNGYKNLRL